MNVMVLGGGGREHAICRGLKCSPEVTKLYCSPGNPGIAQIAECVALPAGDIQAVADFAAEHQIDLVVVGPELPLCQGVADAVRARGIPVFGPSKDAARLEGSKDFSKKFMVKYGIPTAAYASFTDKESALEYVRKEYDAGRGVVVKADGLAAGKGVIVAACRKDAEEAVEECFGGAFGAAGSVVVIEELLIGEEASILALADGKTVIPLVSSQDHKRLLDDDKGPNTGGMGAYSPAPVVTDALMKEIDEKVLQRFLKGVQEEKLDYRGIIYAGIMVTKDGPKVLEFNVRFGDPETEAILPRLESSLADALMKTAQGRVSEINMKWSEKPSVCIVMASEGYPGTLRKGFEITGIEDAEKDGAIVFHAGTSVRDGKIVNSGGRVLVVTAYGEQVTDAIAKAYEAVAKIHWTGVQYRHDIAKRAVNRK
ncbi:MAG: phosphoribosylamine--glycine ligase [Victivallales bacterium]